MTIGKIEIQDILKSIIEDLGFESHVFDIGHNTSSDPDVQIMIQIRNGALTNDYNFTVLNRGNGIIKVGPGNFPDVNLANPESIETLKLIILMIPNLNTDSIVLRKIGREFRDYHNNLGDDNTQQLIGKFKKTFMDVADIIRKHIGY